MSPIRILSSHLSSQISAGEVIDRPSSVIKELIENSIDAKAKNIDISIEKTGFQSIIVKDDGNGIEKDELLLAISRHATSKINTLSDLNNINTFGFRGEALASIRAVSRLKLISCSKKSNVGWSIYSEGSSSYTVLQPIAHPLGTSVVVENLFYNIPVRLKFIKNKRLEFLKIYEVIKKIALSCFDVSISFKRNNKLFVSYNAIKKNDKKIYRLKTIFNQINMNHVFEIRKKFNNIKLFGWLIFPLSLYGSFKKIQYSYVNNRFIYNQTINKAVFDAFETTIGNKKNISFILYITLPPNEVDINIHPTKNEIKFQNTDVIYFFLYRSILDNLKKINVKYFLQNFSSKSKLDQKNSSFADINLISNIHCKKKSLYNNIISINTLNVGYKEILKKNYFSFGRLLTIFQKYYGLVHFSDNLLLVSFPLAKKIVDQNKLKSVIKKKIIPDFFSFDFTFFITLEQKKMLFINSKLLLKFGFNFILKEKCIILKTIPVFLKNQNLDFLLPNFFSFIFSKKKVFIKDIFNWFDMNVVIEKRSWTYLDGISLFLEIEKFCPFIFKKPSLKLFQKINIKEALCILKI